ncbi:MAG: hypothetical protein JRE13_17550, partial [Deltaproteobacteria bacterium]|nr:hypothetical protein [Deltaproteobacteria bacterium]
MSKRVSRNTKATTRKPSRTIEQPGLLSQGDETRDLLEFESSSRNQAAIKVVGVGGGGG